MRKSQRKKNVSTYLKFTLIFLLVFCILLTGIPSYWTIIKLTDREMVNRLQTIVQAAEIIIDGDRLAELGTGDETEPYYQELFQKLLRLKENTGASYIYTMRLIDGKPAFIVDADPDEANPINQGYDVYETEMQQAFEGRLAINPKPIYDTSVKLWSRSAYLPILDSSGNIVAIVGVDITADQIVKEQSIFFRTFFGIGIIGIILIVFFTITISRVLARPLGQLNERLQEVASAKGDLSKRVETNSYLLEVSQLAETINKVQDNSRNTLLAIAKSTDRLREISQRLLDSSQTVSANTQEVSALMEEIRNGAEIQSTSTIEIARVMEDLNANYSQIANASITAEQNSLASTQAAKDGQSAIDATFVILNQVSEFAGRLNDLSSDLDNRSSQIRKIVSLLTDVARQTKVLSLSANIEASKAGEAGRGFSVVAQEIRALADNSQNSVEEIATQVGEVQAVLTETANLAQRFYDLTKESGYKMRIAEERLIEIQTKASESLKFVHHSSDLTQSQVSQTEETTASVAEIAEISKRFAESSQAVASSH